MDHEQVRGAAARAAFDALDDLVVVVAIDATAEYPVVDANPALARLTGRPLEDAIGRPLEDLQPLDALRGFASRADEVVRTGQRLRYQVDREVAAGRATLEVSLCPLPELGSEPPHVVAILHDVSALRRLSDTLVEVERVTRTGTWTWDVADDTVRWSSQLYELFGLTRDEFDPSLAGYLEHVHPDDRPAVEEAIGHTFESGEPFALDHRVSTPAGDSRWLHCTGQRVDDRQGQPIRMSGTAQLADGD